MSTKDEDQDNKDALDESCIEDGYDDGEATIIQNDCDLNLSQYEISEPNSSTSSPVRR
jgi:hypothetical protein